MLRFLFLSQFRGSPERRDYDDAGYKFAVYSMPEGDEGGTTLVFTRVLAWRTSEHSRILGYGKAFQDRMTTRAPTQPPKATKTFRLISTVSTVSDTFFPSIITYQATRKISFIPLPLDGDKELTRAREDDLRVDLLRLTSS